MMLPLIFAAAVVIFAVARARSSTEGYGPWPGARPADNPPPLRTRPRDHRDVEPRPDLPEAWSERRPVGSAPDPVAGEDGVGAPAPGASPLGTAPDYDALACDAADTADPTAPMTLARVPPKTEIVDVFSPDVPAYEGKACLSSACAADDTTTIAALLDGSQVASGWSADAADSSGGRNVSGLLRGVVLSA